MKRYIARILFSIFFAILILSFYSYSEDMKSFRIATTTSIYDSGFLDFVAPEFEKKSNIKLSFLSVGSGQAVRIFKNGDADGIIIHEKSFLDDLKKQKLIQKYTPFVSNQFILVGPKSKKDLFKKVKSIHAAFLIIKDRNLKFVSRADNSATYIRELEIWKLAKTEPDFKGYIKSGQGMGMSLNLANEKEAFILTDEATFYKMKDKLDRLDIVYQNPGEEILSNTYYFAFSPGKTKLAFFEMFLKSKEFKRLVASFNQKYFKKEIYRAAK
ncbi:extracellular solute-binding protein [Caldicellulosiruptor morganii]|uniref:Extracellular solute-binding protein n=1 Tax=Caldicellulosiruptor morganii TaxID=1387555 RepID=A0ABY7BR99_9FIRM|nr:extracellular solute-binding protein [Caldicellulosiruptor morganii]WAM34472.1 extracellular solute-binding protein [Caldicellulosiruptor morganii]